jgi:hypothetical protein
MVPPHGGRNQDILRAPRASHTTNLAIGGISPDSRDPCYPWSARITPEGSPMTAMNVVHMRVKPGMEMDFVRLHKDFDIKNMPGGRNLWLVRSGERSFIVIGEWADMDAMVAARPAMIANLDKLRPLLEDLGGGRGVTEPWSGDVALHHG